MNKKELVNSLAKSTGMKKVDCEKLVEALVETTIGTLKKGESLVLVGFGTFKVIEKKAREGRNPSTGAKIKIPAKKSPKFIPGKNFKETVK